MAMTDWMTRLSEPLPRAPLFLEELAWPQVQALQESGMKTLLLPIGATEQHGPHLPLNTDSVIATAACAYASALTGVPVLPTVRISVSIGHTEKWPGTFAIFHETLIDTVKDIARWCAATGWKQFILVNSHFGNDAVLRVALDRLRFDLVGQLDVAVRNTWALSPDIGAAFTADANDWHANQAETDLMMFLAPETVRCEALAEAADPDRTDGRVFPWMVANTSTNGTTGTPGIGNPTHGEALLRLIGMSLAVLLERARSETPPLSWSRSTTVFGPAQAG
jgi:creatinine amidohydrolase